MRGKAFGLMILLVLLIASTSFAAVCPEVTTIGTLTGADRFEPVRVAVSSSGNVYVSDARNEAVNLYNVRGELVKTIGVSYPLGIAVDASGKVYVGSSDKNGKAVAEVKVFDSSLNPLYTLGSGLGEFGKPLGITVDANIVYVADSEYNVVRAYDIDTHGFLYQFGGTGSAPGNLVKPSNILVHPASGNLIVADRALVSDCSITDISDASYKECGNFLMKGAKVHELTTNGIFVTSFGSFGFEDTAGRLSLIGGLAISNAGSLIVSDRTKDYLHVFDSLGDACIIAYDGSPGSNPQGLAATADGRLYVGASGRVIELGLDNFTKMIVGPEALNYSAQECSLQPATQQVTVSNDGPGKLDFTVSSDAAWLTSSAGGGTVDGAGLATIDINVDKTGLAIGSYTGTLTVASAFGEQTVTVTLEVLPPSTLNVNPSSLSFSANGGNPAAQTLNIELSGGGDWSAVSDSAWLSISPDAGNSSLIATQVSVDATGMDSGSYSGNITLSGSCIAGSVTVPVALDVKAGGNITVETNNDAATFTITGPETHSGTGKLFTVNGATAGTYTITFGGVAGFKTPASYSLDVTNGSTAAFSGTYVDLRKRLNILASMGSSNGKTNNDLQIFNGIGGVLGAIALQDENSNRYWDNAITATGDINGDGVEDLIVSHDIGVITGINTADGSVLFNFVPFADRTYVDLAVGDLDGDGKDDILVSALNWSSNGAAVRAFRYDSGSQGIVDTGVNFTAYSGLDWANSQTNDRRGARIAAGDIDGDGLAEILTVQGGGYSQHNIKVKMYDVDASWNVTSAGSIDVADISSYYSDITAGDIDADGVDDVIISDAPGLTASAQSIKVRAFLATGDMLEFEVDSIRGVEVAAGDLDFDGAAEIVVADGAFREQTTSEYTKIWVWSYDSAAGSAVKDAQFNAFDAQVFGVRVAVGQLVTE